MQELPACGLHCVDLFKQIEGTVQDCSNSSALAMELLQFCTEPSKYIFTI